MTGAIEHSDPLSDFQEGQWWVLELDEWAKTGTDDQKRAVAVVHHMLRAAAVEAARPAPEAVEPLRAALTKHGLGIVDMLQHIEGYNIGYRGEPEFWSHAVALGALRLIEAAYAVPENVKAAIAKYEAAALPHTAPEQTKEQK